MGLSDAFTGKTSLINFLSLNIDEGKTPTKRVGRNECVFIFNFALNGNCETRYVLTIQNLKVSAEVIYLCYPTSLSHHPQQGIYLIPFSLSASGNTLGKNETSEWT